MTGQWLVELVNVVTGEAAFNLVGGYAITHRMLRMFRRGSSGRTT